MTKFCLNKSFLNFILFTSFSSWGDHKLDFFDLRKEVTVLKKGVKDAFQKVQEESEEHLDSINENTNEIQSLQEVCSELDNKIEKIDERMDEIQIALENAGIFKKRKHNFASQIKLTKSETEIYDFLIGTEDEKTYRDISHNSGFDQESIKTILSNLVEKGVPIVQKFINNCAYIDVDQEFKRVLPTVYTV